MAAPAAPVDASHHHPPVAEDRRSEELSPDRPFKLIAGALCLDFTNTVGWWSEDQGREPIGRYERFTRYARIVEWGRSSDSLTDREVDGLMQRMHERPAEAEQVLDRALTLRQAIHWIFVALTEKRAAQPADLAVLNQELHAALSRLAVVPHSSDYTWRWRNDDGALDRVLWPVARSAADLLTSPQRGRVKTCAGEPCGFLFLDTSMNGKRRWCIMAECGNRAKARRHYHRGRPDHRL